MSEMQIRASDLRPGMTYLAHFGPRVITSVSREKDFGKSWLIWRWARAPRSDDGIDCGYGGIVESEADTFMVTVVQGAGTPVGLPAGESTAAVVPAHQSA